MLPALSPISCIHLPPRLPPSLPAAQCCLPLTSSTSCCAGREDFDVRMLGSGRPFVLEIINARAAVPPTSAFAAMQAVLQQVTAAQAPSMLCLLLQLFSPQALYSAHALHCCLCQAAQNIALSLPQSKRMARTLRSRCGCWLSASSFLCEPLCCNVQADHGVQVQALQSVPRSICTLLKVSLVAPVSECSQSVPIGFLYGVPTDLLYTVPKGCWHCAPSA